MTDEEHRKTEVYFVTAEKTLFRLLWTMETNRFISNYFFHSTVYFFLPVQREYLVSIHSLNITFRVLLHYFFVGINFGGYVRFLHLLFKLESNFYGTFLWCGSNGNISFIGSVESFEHLMLPENSEQIMKTFPWIFVKLNYTPTNLVTIFERLTIWFSLQSGFVYIL